ncbi:MAG: hypothetical protein RIC55_06740 [Pirellulaceae bacterium]
MSALNCFIGGGGAFGGAFVVFAGGGFGDFVGAGMPPPGLGAGMLGRPTAGGDLAPGNCLPPAAGFGGGAAEVFDGVEPPPPAAFVQIAPVALHCSQAGGGMPRTPSCWWPHFLHSNFTIVLGT